MSMRYLLERLDRIEAGQLNIQREQAEILRLLKKAITMTQALTDSISALQTEVANLNSVDTAAVALINGIAGQVAAAIAGAVDDSAAVAAVNGVLATLKTNDAALAAAVAANIPVAPPTPAPLPPIVAAPVVPPANPPAAT